jgi:hypothetical protein
VVGAAATPLTRNAKLTSVEAEPDLSRQVRALVATPAKPHWIGWQVITVKEAGTSCCFDSMDEFNKSGGKCWGCELEDEGGVMIGTRSDDVTGGKSVNLEGPRAMSILLRAASGKIGRVRAFSESCGLDAGGLSFTWIENVPPTESLELLEKLALDTQAQDDDGDSFADSATMAIAMHKDPQADLILTRLAAPGHDEDLREQALFWLGNTRGRKGYEILKQVVKEDLDEDIRDKAVFALSQNDTPEALDVIIDVARNDKSGDVRGQALFWLAQEAGDRAAASINEAVERDPEIEVKKKAVFALTQLPEEQGVPLLMKLASTHRSVEVRKEAIFWLGQSEDPRALDFIEDILTR